MAVARHARAGRAVEDFKPHFEKQLPPPAWLKLPPRQFQTVSGEVNERSNQLVKQALDKWDDELLALHMTALNEALADADASAKRIELEFTARVPPLMEKYRLAIADTSVSDPDIVEFEKIVFKRNLERGTTYLRIAKIFRKEKGYSNMVRSAYQHIDMLDCLPHSLRLKPKPAPTAAPDETAAATAAAATTAGATVEETGAGAIATAAAATATTAAADAPAAAAAAGATTAAAAHPQHSSKQTPPRSSKLGSSTPKNALLPIQAIQTTNRLVNSSQLLSREEIAWLDNCPQHQNPPETEPATAAATPAAAGRSPAPTPPPLKPGLTNQQQQESPLPAKLHPQPPPTPTSRITTKDQQQQQQQQHMTRSSLLRFMHKQQLLHKLQLLVLQHCPASRTGHPLLLPGHPPLLLPGHPLLPSAKGMKTSSSSSSTTTLAGTTTMISHSNSSSSSIFLADPHQPGTTTVQHQAEAAGMETEKEEGSRTGVTTTGMGGATTATKGTAQARARSSSSS